MPIDRKWIKNHPDQVEDWQRARQLEDSSSFSSSVVKRAVALDQLCRERLYWLDRCRERLNLLAQQLRPGQHPPDDREKLRNKRDEWQQQVRDVQQQHAKAQSELQRVLWTLASPIDGPLLEQFPALEVEDDALPSVPETNRWDVSSSMGWHWHRAIVTYAHVFFGRKYPQNHSLPWDDAALVQWQRQHTDLLHDMWGCQGLPLSKTPCVICTLEQEQESWNVPNKKESSSSRTLSPALPPAWLTWIAESVPRKSIWGSKELPRYTMLRGTSTRSHRAWNHNNNNNDITKTSEVPKKPKSKKQPTPTPASESTATAPQETVELLAMTAGTTWDARQIQLEVAHEIAAFYETLLNDGNAVSLQVVPPPQLERHEQSRVVIVATPSANHKHNKPVPLGWVSNFGDAASRACDISFRGGGLAGAKDKVYWVHGTIVGPDSISHLVSCQTAAVHSNDKLAIPPCLEPFLPTPLEVGTTARTTSILAPARTDVSLTTTAVAWTANTTAAPATTTKNHISLLDPTLSKRPGQQVRAEALACPFGFLLH